MIPGRRILHFIVDFVCVRQTNRGGLRRRNNAFGWMAERSKALVSGTSLFGGEGSNPSSVNSFLEAVFSFLCGRRDRRTCRRIAFGWMAERSKALVSGTSLFGGEGSNPSSVNSFCIFESPARFRKTDL